MSFDHYVRSGPDDRDLSRAASERYLMLQALSERADWAPHTGRSRIATFLHAVRALRPGSHRPAVTAEPAGSAR